MKVRAIKRRLQAGIGRPGADWHGREFDRLLKRVHRRFNKEWCDCRREAARWARAA